MKKILASVAAAVITATAAAPALANGYTQTQYPIVLVHGLFGFDRLGPLEYFHKIPEALRADGARVFVAQVSPGNSTEVRGEQLLSQVRQIMAMTGAPKVNIIGHSHGGPTARYVAGVAPQIVASVTSVGGVNRGSKFADTLSALLPPGSTSTSLVGRLVDATLLNAIAVLSGGTQLPKDSAAALYSLSTKGSAEFNRKFPAGVPTSGCGEGAYAVNGVRYFSWGGNRVLTNVLDVTDPALGVTSLAFGFEQNDGLVGTCSMNLGRVISTSYAQNHLDEVNQLAGLVNIWSTNPVTLYRQHANRLKNAGL
jgi:triacylglycerol lipase